MVTSIKERRGENESDGNQTDGDEDEFVDYQ